MNGFPFGPGEYTTFYLPHDGEEHIVPRSLVEKSEKIRHSIHTSHDNSFILPPEIASSTFGDLLDYLSSKTPPLDPKRIQLMIEAARNLEFKEAEDRLTQIFQKTFEDFQKSSEDQSVLGQ